MCESITRRLRRVGTTLVLASAVLASCSTAPREAAPLDIERAPDSQSLPAGPPPISKVAYANALAQSPGHFFQRMPVTPVLAGKRFIGYSVIALYGDVAPHPEGVFIGDVVTKVNGLAINTPDNFHRAWVAARGRRTLTVDVLRNNTARRITYRIID